MPLDNIADRTKRRRLPAVDVPVTQEDEVRRSLEAMREHLRMYEGDSFAPKERFATIEELELAGLIGTKVQNGFAFIDSILQVPVSQGQQADSAPITNITNVTGATTLRELTDTAVDGALPGSFLRLENGLWRGYRIFDEPNEWNAEQTFDACIRIRGPGETNFVRFCHDDTDLNISHIGTTDINIFDLNVNMTNEYAIEWNDIEYLRAQGFVVAAGDWDVQLDVQQAEQTTSSATFQDTATQIDCSTLVEGDTYLLVTRAACEKNSQVNANMEVRVLNPGGAAVADSTANFLGSGTQDQSGELYFFTFTFVAPATGTYKLQFRNTGGETSRIHSQQMLALNMTQLGASNWSEATDTTDRTLVRDSNNDVSSTATLSGIGDGTTDWLVFSSFVAGNRTQGDGDPGFRLQVGDGTSDYVIRGFTADDWPGDTGYKVTGGAFILRSPNNVTLTPEGRVDNGPFNVGCEWLHTHIVAFNLGAIESAQIAYSASETPPGAVSPITVLTDSFTQSLGVTADYLFLGCLYEDGKVSPTAAWEITADINSGGAATRSWGGGRFESTDINTSVGGSMGTTQQWGQLIIPNSLVSLNNNDSVVVDLDTDDYQTNAVWSNIALITLPVKTASQNLIEFKVGDANTPLELCGTRVSLQNNIPITWDNAAGANTEELILRPVQPGDPLTTALDSLSPAGTDNLTIQSAATGDPRWYIGTSDFTIEFWAWWDTNSTLDQIIFGADEGFDGQRSYLWYWDESANNMVFSYTTDGSTRQTATFSCTPPENQWAFYQLRRSGANLELWIDGTQQGSTYNIGASTDLFHYQTNPENWVRIGNAGWFLAAFAGIMQEFRFTIGTARSTTVPTEPFPRGAQDPDWRNVRLMISFDGTDGQTAENAVDESLYANTFVASAMTLEDAELKFTAKRSAPETFVIGDPSHDVQIDGEVLTVTARTQFNELVFMDSTLDVFGTTTAGELISRGALTARGNTELQGTLEVDGRGTFNADLYVTDELRILGPGGTDYMNFVNDDTDVTTTFSGIVDWDITGLTGQMNVMNSFAVSGSSVILEDGIPLQGSAGVTHFDMLEVVPDPSGDPFWDDVELLILGEGADEATSYTTEDTGARTVTFTNGAKLDSAVTPKFNATTAVFFDGTNDYISVPDSDDFDLGTGNFTLEMWMYFNTDPDTQNMFVIGQWSDITSTQRAWVFDITSAGSLRFRGSSTGFDTQTATVSSPGWTTATWYHVAIVRNGDNISFWRDGTQVGTDQAFGTSFDIQNGATPIEAGYNVDSSNLPYHGLLEGIRLTRAARYTATFTAPAAAFPTFGTNPAVTLGDQTGTRETHLIGSAVAIKDQSATAEVLVELGTFDHEIPFIISKHKPTNTARNTTTTLADDAHLVTGPLLADTHYAIDMLLIVDSASGTPDFDYALNFSQTIQDSQVMYQSVDEAANVASDVVLATTENTANLTGTDIMMIRVTGFVETNATTGGTCALQWAQNVSDATDVTLLNGSYLRLTRLVQ